MFADVAAQVLFASCDAWRACMSDSGTRGIPQFFNDAAVPASQSGGD
jgi:hypothetical protein